jgi:hypothetical protein
MKTEAMDELDSAAQRHDTLEQGTSALSKPKRPRAVLFMAAAYLTVAFVLLLLAVKNSGDKDLSNTTRILLGAAGIVFFTAAAFSVMRFEWARKLCVGLHAVAIGGMVVLTVQRCVNGSSSDVHPIVQGLAGVSVQFAFIRFWSGHEVVTWFAWRREARDVHDASTS